MIIFSLSAVQSVAPRPETLVSLVKNDLLKLWKLRTHSSTPESQSALLDTLKFEKYFTLLTVTFPPEKYTPFILCDTNTTLENGYACVVALIFTIYFLGKESLYSGFVDHTLCSFLKS